METVPLLSNALLVDDDASVRFALKMLMDSIGWQSTEAVDAQAALDCLKTQSYRLLIADINMPGMNGIELCRSICQSGAPNMPVCIILSGLVNDKIREEARIAGAVAVLVKPMGRQDMIDEFKKHGLC